jgi:hypothetical protein
MAGKKQVSQLSLEGVLDYAVQHAPVIRLPRATAHEKLANAQRYLEAAHESVDTLLMTMQLSRALSKALTGKDPRGRLQEHEVDLLRAAVVFAAAGLDATLKELIRTATVAIAAVNEDAGAKFAEFVDRYLGSANVAIDRKALTRILIAPEHSRFFLLDEYVADLTGDSLQSAEQVGRVCSALGITDTALRKRMGKGETLDEMFRARNEIVHELDLTRVGKRRSRPTTKVMAWVTEALSMAQEVINRVSDTLRGNPRHPGVNR